MGEVKKNVDPVKLFCGILFSDESILEKAVGCLVRKFGPVDNRSQTAVFDQTAYYEEEMGKGLRRIFVSFRRLIRREEIVRVKLLTNRIEKQFPSPSGGRTVNLDPGYMTPANVSLATTKDFQHRIYLGKGIYLENTLRFRKGAWTDWEWTYPDYRTEFSRSWFREIHGLYREQLRKDPRKD